MRNLPSAIEWLVLALVFLLPWQTRYFFSAQLNEGFWEYGTLSLFATDFLVWLIVALFAVWLGRTRLAVRWQTLRERLHHDALTRVYATVVLFAVVAGVSCFWAFDRTLAQYHWVRLMQALAIFAVVAVGPVRLPQLAWALVCSGVVQSLLGVWQFFALYVPANKWLGLALHTPTLGGSIILESAGERWLRAYGAFPHPNILGAWLLLGLLVAVGAGMAATTPVRRRAVLAAVVLLTPGLFLSFSRSAWIGLVVGLAVLGGGAWRSRDAHALRAWKVLVGIVVSILLVLGALLVEPLAARLFPVERIEIDSLRLRVTFAEQAWQVVRATTPLGVGLGNYTLGVYRVVSASWPAWYYQPVHNIFLLSLAELGLAGALVFVGLLGQMGHALLKRSARAPAVRMCAACIVGLFCIGLVDHFLWTLNVGLLMWWGVFGAGFQALRRTVNR